MSKLKVILFVCVVASVTSCFIFDECAFRTDCGNDDEKLPAYANESGETVKIVTVIEYYTPDGIVPNNHENFITDGDTLHYAEEEWYISIPVNSGCGSVSFGNCGKPTRMELHFLGEPEKCLIFDGPIEHDSIDIRSWDSYKRGNEIPGWANFWAGVEYVYTITHQHMEMAKEEDCQSLASD